MRKFFAFLLAMMVASTVGAGDMDVDALRQKIAALDAAIQSFEAQSAAGASKPKAAEGVTSLRKNASVTIGGFLYNRYHYNNIRVDSAYNNPGNAAPTIDMENGKPKVSRKGEAKGGDLHISHARLNVRIALDDHFDAFAHLDLLSSQDNRSDNAHRYWVRWKKIANSGFGVKVGRDDLIWGDDNAVGQMGTIVKSGEGAFWCGGWGSTPVVPNVDSYSSGYKLPSRLGMTASGVMPIHNIWDNTRVDQIAPYWEGAGGKVKVEASLFQNHSNFAGRINNNRSQEPEMYRDLDGAASYHSRNYGLGSFSARMTVLPLEGLKLSASVVNFYDNLKSASALTAAESDSLTRNNTAVNLAASYRPAFLKRLYVWAEGNHGWNVRGFEDVDALAVNAGVSFDLTERLTVFAQGDWLKTTDTYGGYRGGVAHDDRATYWASYCGVLYTFPVGAALELGWKHEETTWRQNVGAGPGGVPVRVNGDRQKTVFARGDLLYAHLGFMF